MATHKTFTLSEQNQAKVDAYVASGHFATPDEVVKAGLELLQDQQRRIEALRQAIEEGEASGIAQGFTFEGFLKKKRQQYGTPQE